MQTLKNLLTKARKKRYAVAAFNINNMEILQAVIEGAKRQKSPVIIQTTEGAIKYAGKEYLKCLMDAATKESKIPTALHLDHGKNIGTIKQCIKMGWTSVMIDGSHLPFKKNISITKKIAELAHRKGISVEGELGTIGGTEERVHSKEIIYTDPDKAKEFVEKTGIDALAVAIGTSHGAYKFPGKPKLELERLKQINKKAAKPLVLHGASQVPGWLVRTANKYGAKLSKTEGVPDNQLKQAIKNGICKVNTDTDLRLAFNASVRRFLKENPKDFDPRHILGEAKKLIQKVAEHRIKVCGSKGKA